MHLSDLYFKTHSRLTDIFYISEIEKKKQKKGINKPFVLATASMVLSLALMLVVIVMLIKVRNRPIKKWMYSNNRFYASKILSKYHYTGRFDNKLCFSSQIYRNATN